MHFHNDFQETIGMIRSKIGDFQPKVGLILGSGLGSLSDEIKNAIRIPYHDIPHFPISRVAGHEGTFISGTLEGVPVICLNGRVHFYEGPAYKELKMLIRAIKGLDCHTLIITNAAGSLRKEVTPGEICMITDHINFIQTNPLVGINDEEFGPRFLPMTDAYHPELRQKLAETAKANGIVLHQGVYVMTFGPCFETPAEIRALRTLGADLVGMSTISEVIIARHCGLKVLAVSAVTNLAADISDVPLSHEHTLKNAKTAGQKLKKLIRLFLARHADEFNQSLS